MRRSRAREHSLLLLFSLLLPATSTATPLSQSLEDTELIDSQNITLAVRGGCENPCGYQGWLCCGASQKCYTDYNNRASCSNYAGTMSQAPGGYWTTYTSTYIETDQVTHTSCWSSWITPVAATTSSWCPPSGTAAVAYCNTANGETSCGNICCASYQYCAVAGQCAAAATSSPYGAPVRPTSSGAVVYTATITTATVPFETPVGTAQAATITAMPGGTFTQTDEGGGGLSGGAIAGIVIGVILAVLFLLLLLLFLCFRSAWHALLALFGLGRRKKRRTEVEYSEYRRHGSRTASGRYYDDGRRVEYDPREEKKKKGNGFGWGTVAAGLGALGLAFGLKKRHDRKKREEEKSDYSSSYDYTTSYGYTDSESSGRRTYSTRHHPQSRR